VAGQPVSDPNEEQHMGWLEGIPREDIDWGPTIDEAACRDGCRVCLDFCKQGVYGLVDGRVLVAERTSCVVGCSHCASLCDAGAIAFPSLEDLRKAHPRT
jgi:NAD-dependent dihydropyrimidine dehydrogenase PreA subunit